MYYQTSDRNLFSGCEHTQLYTVMSTDFLTRMPRQFTGEKIVPGRTGIST